MAIVPMQTADSRQQTADSRQQTAARIDLTSWLAAVLAACYIHTGLYTLKVGAGRAERWSVTLAMGS